MNNRYRHICRGKRIDNDEWVEGYLYITHNDEYEIGKYDEEINIERVTYIVIPETVGECTTLPDKNGKLMYTGDIINALFDFGMPIKSVCAFRDGSFGLLAKQHGAEHFHPFTSLCNISYEIIGNIHDNKELFEVER